MKVLYNPVRSDDSLVYQFHNDAVTVTLNEQTEVFDFSAMPDGELKEVSTSLPVNPIVKAERKNGELSLVLLHFHGANASEDELFPSEKIVTEFVEVSEPAKAALTFLTQAELDALKNVPHEPSELEKLKKQQSDLVFELMMKGVI